MFIDTSIQHAATNVINHTIDNGGGTFDPTTLAPVTLDKGYAVAIKGLEYKVPFDTIDEWDVVTHAFNVLSHSIDNPGVYFGTWVDNGIVYFDASDVVQDEATALRIAREHNQLAVWDFARNSEIRVNETVNA